MRDDEILKLKVAIETDDWTESVKYKRIRHRLAIRDELIVKDDFIVVLPECLTRKAMVIAHKGHPR